MLKKLSLTLHNLIYLLKASAAAEYKNELAKATRKEADSKRKGQIIRFTISHCLKTGAEFISYFIAALLKKCSVDKTLWQI